MSMMLMLLGAGGAGGGYLIEKSLRFVGADSASLRRDFDAGDQKKWTYSYWVKRCGDTVANHWYNSFLWCEPGLSGNLRFDDATTSKMYGILASGITFTTTTVFRDYTAWMHIVLVYDSENTTAGDRIQLYVNGVRDTTVVVTGTLDGNDSFFNAAEIHAIGQFNTNTGLNCYLADVYFIGGYAKVPGDFAETNGDTGQWVPIEYSGSYGTNGCHLKFDGTDPGEDSSGEGNNWESPGLAAYYGTPTTITAADTFSDDVTASGAFSGTRTADKMFVSDRMDAADKYAYVDSSSSSSHITWTPATAITAHNGYVWISGGDGNGYGLDHSSKTVSINGSTATVQATRYPDSSANLRWYKFTVSGTFTSLKVEGDYPRINGVSFQAEPEWEGTHMVDGRAHMSNNPLHSDVSIDTPTPDEDSGTSNYCTLNPFTSVGQLVQGNLQTHNGAGNYTGVSSWGFDSGKWYAEFTLGSSHAYPGLGFTYEGQIPSAGWMATQPPYFFVNDGGPITGLSSYPGGAMVWNPATPGGAGRTISTVLAEGVWQLAMDCDNGKGWIGFEDTWYNDEWNLTGSDGDPAAGTNPTFTLATDKTWYFFLHANDTLWTANFGQRAFQETKPSNFLAPSSNNLSETPITSGSYTGNGSADGPVIFTNCTPATLKIHTVESSVSGSTPVTFSPTIVDRLASGFKIRHASTNNGSGTTYYWAVTSSRAFKYANAQPNS